MNSVGKTKTFEPNAAAAAAVVVGVLAGFTELNTGQDQNAALMVWFFFVLCSGFLLQLSKSVRYAELLVLSLQPAVALAVVQLAGAYFYGITDFSSMTWDWSSSSVVKLLALIVFSTFMIAVVARAGPVLQLALANVFKLTQRRAQQIVKSVSGVGAIVAAFVLLYKLIVLHQGSPVH